MTGVPMNVAPTASESVGLRVADAYVHIGLPRFQSVADCLAVMDDVGISSSLVCPFDSCPDVTMIHEAVRTYPDRIVGLGIPIGADRSEVTAGIHAQLDAGLVGIRLSENDVVERGWLLDVIGSRGAFALVCGSGGLASGAATLLRYIESYESALVVGGHLAGPTDRTVFDSDSVLSELYAGDQFAVVMSRQGHFPVDVVDPWIEELIGRVGWGRLLWGSEAPVLYWRDDTVENALAGFERYLGTDVDRVAFFGGNFDRLVSSRSREVKELKLPFDPWAYEVRRPVPAWPFGLPLDHDLAGPLVHSWIMWGGSARGPLREYLAEVIRAGVQGAGS